MGTKAFNDLFEIKELSQDNEFEMMSQDDIDALEEDEENSYDDGEECFLGDEQPLEIEDGWLEESDYSEAV